MKYRLVTRSDFDGLVCAVLLHKLKLIDDVVFVHPKQVQDAEVQIGEHDILTNLPYAPAAYRVFDHHRSEVLRVGGHAQNHVIDPSARSAARVVYNYYGGASAFPGVSEEMMDAVDIGDSAGYEIQDILYPQGWALLNVLMDSRTGLGRFRHFRISNYQLMMRLIDICGEVQDVEKILAYPDVAERVETYRGQANAFTEQLRRLGRLHEDVVVVDYRKETVIHAGNRFMVYALFPQARVSIHVLPGRNGTNTVFAVGKSILDRTSPVDIGAVMLAYGGGGHAGAGSCQVANDHAEHALADLLGQLKREKTAHAKVGDAIAAA